MRGHHFAKGNSQWGHDWDVPSMNLTQWWPKGQSLPKSLRTWLSLATNVWIIVVTQSGAYPISETALTESGWDQHTSFTPTSALLPRHSCRRSLFRHPTHTHALSRFAAPWRIGLFSFFPAGIWLCFLSAGLPIINPHWADFMNNGFCGWADKLKSQRFKNPPF